MGFDRSFPIHADAWQLAQRRILACDDPWRSPHFAELYAIAITDGQRTLARFRRIDPSRRADLVHELFARSLDAILRAQSPRAFFVRSLRNLAIQWLRRADALVLPDPVREPIDERDAAQGLDLGRVLGRLSPRDAAIVLAVAMGEERTEIARAHGVTRENVDQIVSRSRARLAEEE